MLTLSFYGGCAVARVFFCRFAFFTPDLLFSFPRFADFRHCCRHGRRRFFAAYDAA